MSTELKQLAISRPDVRIGSLSTFLALQRTGVVPAAEDDESSSSKDSDAATKRHSRVATDGTYLYIHGSSGLWKVGSGLNGTLAGRVYASNTEYRPTETAWLAFANGVLYYRSPRLTVPIVVIGKSTI